MASLQLPISQPGTRCKCCFSHLVMGMLCLLALGASTALITAVPIAGSRAAIPKCCRKGA